ncbi:MAG TPA: nitrate reductase molybdenum cofactor assembly chaperone [Mycobacteriales bacterium]|nr:nitrate reductase molybdenum cofactor assembly chaperone [Mycobacteriales bacterium]
MRTPLPLRQPLPVHQRRVVHQVASLLLGYPDDELLARLPLLRAAVAGLRPAAAAPLSRMLEHLAGTPPERLRADYVETFDLRRRCCLYLTYYTHGDTRRRGLALLRFTRAYRAAGMDPVESELPDHLAVVLEFAATGDPDSGDRLLREHRAGLELLRLSLQEAGSPYADVLVAVGATLPEVDARNREAVLRLARSGPPTEEVGLDPYGGEAFAPPEAMGTTTGAATRGAGR